jgi:hypothetical protein
VTCAICTGTLSQSDGFDHDLRTLRLSYAYALGEGSDRLEPTIPATFHTITTCKSCRGDFLEVLWKWANGGFLIETNRADAGISPRGDDRPEANIPLRVAGRTVMVTREEWDAHRASKEPK